MKPVGKPGPIRSLLVANRGEIAIRVMRAATELGIRTVAIHSHEDRFSLHRTKADESYLVGEGKGPDRRLSRHRRHHPHRRRGARRRDPPGLRLPVGEPGIRRGLRRGGHRLRRSAARHDAQARQQGRGPQSRRRSAGVPVMPATPPLPADAAAVLAMARAVGFPVMLKASWGGGGRGMRVVENDGDADRDRARRRGARRRPPSARTRCISKS